MSLPREYRLNLRQSRKSLDLNGKRFFGTHFTLLVSSSPNLQKTPRFAILVSKKTSSLSVDRNLIKRKISGLLKDQFLNTKNFDILIIPKRSILTSDISQLSTDLAKILRSL